MYCQGTNTISTWVVKGGYLKEHEYGPVHLSTQFIINLWRFYIGFRYFTLNEILPYHRNAPPRVEFQGWMSRVRVDTLVRGVSKVRYHLLLDTWMSFILTHCDGDGRRRSRFVFRSFNWVGNGSLNAVTFSNLLLANGNISSWVWLILGGRWSNTNTGHKLKLLFYSLSSIKQSRSMSDIPDFGGSGYWNSLVVGPWAWSLWNTSSMIAQHVWRYVVNIMWQLHVKRTKAMLWKSFLVLQCLFDDDLPNPLKKYHRIWFFLSSALTWIHTETKKITWTFNTLSSLTGWGNSTTCLGCPLRL